MSTSAETTGRTSDSPTVPEPSASVGCPPNRTTTDEAKAVLQGSHTPEQLETAIKAQGDRVEWFYLCGQMPKAREAFAVVKTLVAMRTPETVEAMERSRGLR